MSSTHTPSKAADAVAETTQNAAHAAEKAMGETRKSLNKSLDALEDGVKQASHTLPHQLHEGVAQVESLTRHGLAAARELGQDVRTQVDRAGERTVNYIQHEPVKAVLIAAGTGALVALLVRALSGRGN